VEKDIRYVRSAIEDLAFTNRSSRESDKVGQRGCIEHDFSKGLESRAIMGTEAKWQRLGVSTRSSAAAEKGDEGMALKIRTRAEDMPDGY
jgi:hypothetical protein